MGKAKIVLDIEKRLFELVDEKYRDFNMKLIPSADKNTAIGVRTPDLRNIAKEFFVRDDINDFLDELPHEYYEEMNLHGFFIERLKDYDEIIRRIDEWLPYVDNWATCDLVSPKLFKKHTDRLIHEIERWIKSEKTYTIRFGVEMLMSFYLDDKFKKEYLDIVSAIRSDEYYVNMMTAWFFATALAKQRDAAMPYIEKHKLDKWTHNKAIQKSVESNRISQEDKDYLRTLKY